MLKLILIIIAVIIAIVSIILQNPEKGIPVAIVIFLGGISQGVLSEYAADFLETVFSGSEPTVVEEHLPPESAPQQEAAVTSGQSNTETSAAPEQDSGGGSDYTANTSTAPAPTPAPESAPTPEPAPAPEPADPLSGLTNISSQTSVSGSVIERDQVNQYRYTAPTDGTYQFDSGLDYGKVSLQIDNAYGGKLASGSSSMSAELEAGKTYILRVKYSSTPMDYTIQIGVPNPVTDITGQTSVSGSLTYLTQSDRYTYTASISGVHQFNAVGMNFNALRLAVLNPQGQKLNSGSPSVSVTLEAGKTYTLCVETTSHFLDYTIHVNVPNPPVDVTASAQAAGTLTYSSQIDQYYDTAPADGSYRFDTGLGYGGVSMKVQDENGTSCGVSANSLTVTLKAGTQYILNVYKEYANLPVEYTVSIIPQ